MILLLLSLLAGVLTVLAPCTISLLPVIVGGTLAGQRSAVRAMRVTASLGVSVVVFTILLKASSALIQVPQSFWQYLSGGIIVALGIVTIFPTLYEHLPLVNRLNRSSSRLLSTGYDKHNAAGDLLVGAALGPVFSSCSPTYFLILATVLPRSFALGLVYLLAYAAGLCGALLLVTLAGQKLLKTFRVAANPGGWFKRAIGVLFVLVGAAILLGYDKKLEVAVAGNVFDVTKIEQSLLARQTGPPPVPGTRQAADTSAGPEATSAPAGAATSGPSADGAARIRAKQRKYPSAPEITNPSGFVNTDGQPITISQFRHKKVVLIDFWTYSCINCQRTLPYLKAWYDKYHDQGLEIIGIHTPEFAFEKVQGNVEAAVKGFGLKYPSVLDNDYGAWNAFGNSFWPRKYLIDIDGFVIYDHAGEGEYDQTEHAIQQALRERNEVLGQPTSQVPGSIVQVQSTAVDPRRLGSPETYFGAARNEYVANGSRGQVGPQTLNLPASAKVNRLYLGGSWDMQDEFARSGANAKIIYRFQAKNAYFVARSGDGATLHILLDGKPPAASAGQDVAGDGTALVKEDRLYKLISLGDYGEHTLEIDVAAGSVDAYTFTFG
jgi:cytochrome c biogenesis protein CcdA/thiol-disulfide isomerase/thioredoxin